MSKESAIEHLLWSLNMAVSMERREKPFRSERETRNFISNWLDTSRQEPAFLDMAWAFTQIRDILTHARQPAAEIIFQLWQRSVSTNKCPMYRWQAAMNRLRSKGWHHSYCPHADQILGTVFSLRNQHNPYVVQISETRNTFSPTGEMLEPATLELVVPNGTPDTAEQIFHDEGFTVFRGKDLRLTGKTTVKTVYIGTPALTLENGHCWQPAA